MLGGGPIGPPGPIIPGGGPNGGGPPIMPGGGPIGPQLPSKFGPLLGPNPRGPPRPLKKPRPLMGGPPGPYPRPRKRIGGGPFIQPGGGPLPRPLIKEVTI